MILLKKMARNKYLVLVSDKIKYIEGINKTNGKRDRPKSYITVT